jgi:hypothetical protein
MLLFRKASKRMKKRSTNKKQLSYGKRYKKKSNRNKKVSKRSSGKSKRNMYLKLWRESAMEEGFMRPGADFKKLPKKGTRAYDRIKSRYEDKKYEKGL